MTPNTAESHVTTVAGTEHLGQLLGQRLRAGDLVCLDGELGAGKTCFVRGLAAGVGIDPTSVRSPTFVVHHVYAHQPMPLHHIDFYRLGGGADIGFLDLDDLLADGAVAVEWAEYADLDAWRPARVVIECGEGDRRTLRLETSAEHLADAWRDAP